MMQYNELGLFEDPNVLDNIILFLDDVFDKSGENWKATYLYPAEDAFRFSTQAASLFTSNPVHQLCKSEEGVTISSAAFCKKQTVPSPSSQLQTCFSQFHAGLSYDFFYFPYGREMMSYRMRNLAYTRLNIAPSPSEEISTGYLRDKEIVIAFHKKPLSGKHGAGIANVEEMMAFVSDLLPQEDFMAELLINRKLRIEIVNLLGMSIPEQVKYFSNVDLYITDQGSAAYYALFMRDETSVIVAPACISGGKCSVGLAYRMQSYTNVHIYSVLDFTHLNPVKCNPRPVPAKPNNCDPILPLDVTYESIKVMLKNRYRAMLSK